MAPNLGARIRAALRHDCLANDTCHAETFSEFSCIHCIFEQIFESFLLPGAPPHLSQLSHRFPVSRVDGPVTVFMTMTLVKRI